MRLVVNCGFLVCLFAFGCGGGPAYTGAQRFSLSGKVTLDGMPVSGGSIVFVPQSSGLNPSGGEIQDGQYSVPEERGANAGVYRVEIRWPRPTGKKIMDEDTAQMIEETAEAIPSKYNTQSELKAEVAKGKTTFDFDLKSK
jgi:hypothetical protein